MFSGNHISVLLIFFHIISSENQLSILLIYLLLSWSKLGRILFWAFALVGITPVFTSQIIFELLIQRKVFQYIESVESNEQLYGLTLFINEESYSIQLFITLHMYALYILGEDYLRCKNENVTNQYKSLCSPGEYSTCLGPSK